MIPATGAIPSSPDYRDGIALSTAIAIVASALPSLPAIFATKLDQFKVLDQNKQPACVSHAWALVMMYWWYKTHGEIVEFSPRFLDILSSQPWIPIDGGRVPRDVCKVSASIGCCTVAMLPNDTEGLSIAQYRNPSVITQVMKDEAAKYKIPGYVRIPDAAIDDFRRAIVKYDLVSGLFQISDAFWLPSWLTKDINPLKTKTPTSGHQMVVNGFHDQYNTIRNSWSAAWNINGNGDYDTAAWLDFILEGWAIASIPQDVQTLLSQLPKPEDFHYNWTRDLSAGNVAPDDDVKFVQIGLMILGLLDPVPPDSLGYFGPRTSKAVLAYQALKKIPMASRNANRIGPLTRGFLNKDFAL